MFLLEAILLVLYVVILLFGMDGYPLIVLCMVMLLVLPPPVVLDVRCRVEIARLLRCPPIEAMTLVARVPSVPLCRPPLRACVPPAPGPRSLLPLLPRPPPRNPLVLLVVILLVLYVVILRFGLHVYPLVAL